MRLLIIGINYAPEESGNAPYTTGLAEHLAGRGDDVHVLTGFPHYPAWTRDPTGASARYEVRNGVHVHRHWHYVPGSQSAIKRALYEGSFLSSAKKLLSLPRPDAVIGVIPTLSGGMLARVVARRFGVPYGLIFQDLMGQAARQSGLPGGSSVERIVRGGERWVARGAAAIAIVTEGFRDYAESLGVPADRIVRVRNWSQTPPAGDPGATRLRFGLPADAFLCLHAGNMGYKQGLMNIVESARLAQHALPQAVFVLAGDGSQRQALEARAGQHRLTNLRFLPSQTKHDHADLLAAADVLILNQSASVTDMAFPSKVSSYVASGRPIIAAVAADSAVARELDEAGAALLVDSGAPEKLLEGIARLARDDVTRRRLIVAAGRYSRLFSSEDALRGLESFVDRILGREAFGRVEAELLQEAA